MSRVIRTLFSLIAAVVGFYLGLWLVLAVGGLEAATWVPVVGLALSGLLAGLAAGRTARRSPGFTASLSAAAAALGALLGGLIVLLELDVPWAAAAGVLIAWGAVQVAGRESRNMTRPDSSYSD